ncbi:LytTR family DNA-binding domain-containing protein [Ulvibacterium sp.]|uniref:LytR/AlgR family response regulator transcription factor n=1 Tax=Ulvibacterium sp. TaxID=2665914 RepID=UPI002604F215|nr:LytTR family DNA-binding domain-containing protein [Ulvibacterium sp.]
MLSKYLGKYNDVLLFLILIPIINTINYHLTYSTIRWDWYTYTTYFIDTVQGYIAWGLIKWIILWLDKRIPYEKALVQRLVVQILATNLIAQGFIILATEIINALFGEGPLPISFYSYNLFIFFIWILVINGIYIGFYLYDQWLTAQSLRDKDKELRSKGFSVVLGNSTKHIAFEQIAIFYVEDRATFLRAKTGEQFVLDDSLNKIFAVLPEENFFRLNRKYIVHREQIKGYKKEINGKLLVEFDFGPSTQTSVVSRTNAPEFKKWFSITAPRF